MQRVDFAVGQVIDRKFRVERVLGSGGMGLVVAAWHLQLGKRVALKFLIGDGKERVEAVSRFLREGRAMAQIKSAHVAHILDVGGLEPGEPYLVMEYLEGSDLATLLKLKQRLSISEATDYILQACEGVAEAHAIGIVHRDLKPSNLFLTTATDGKSLIKVLDFGISKFIAFTSAETTTQHATTTGALIGSPNYMSPEQIRDARSVDRRTDIWALGVVLYQLLSGRLPFQGTSVAGTLAAVAADQPVPIRRVQTDVPRELELVLLRCLDKNLERRYASLEELARALADFAPAEAGTAVARIHKIVSSCPMTTASAVVAHSPNGEPVTQLATARQQDGSQGAQRKRPDRARLAAWLGGLGALIGIAVVAQALRLHRNPPVPSIYSAIRAPQTTFSAAPSPFKAKSEAKPEASSPPSALAPQPSEPSRRDDSLAKKSKPARAASRASPARAATSKPMTTVPDELTEEDGTHDRK